MTHEEFSGAAKDVQEELAKTEHKTRILQYWIHLDGYSDLVRGRSADTICVSLDAKDLSGFPLVVPSDSLTSKFSKHVSRIRANVGANAAEMQTLTSLRDSLLPQFISGELRTKQVEAIA